MHTGNSGGRGRKIASLMSVSAAWQDHVSDNKEKGLGTQLRGKGPLGLISSTGGAGESRQGTLCLHRRLGKLRPGYTKGI